MMSILLKLGKGLHAQNLIQIAKLIWGYRWRFAIGLFFLVIVDALQLIVPKLIQNTIDHLTNGTATSTLLWLTGLGYFGLQALTAILRFGWRYFISGTGLRIERDLRFRLYQKLQQLSYAYYTHTKTGTVMSYATNDVPAVRMATGMALLGAVDAAFISIASITIMFYTNWLLALWVLIPIPFVSLIMRYFGKRLHQQFLKVQESYSHICDRVQESFSAIKVVKAYGIEQIELDHFNTESKKLGDDNMRLAKLEAFFEPSIAFFSATGIILLWCVGGRMVLKGSISLGEFTAMFFYLNLLTWPMMAIGWVFNLLQRGTASIERLKTVFSQQPSEGHEPYHSIEKVSIEVKNLCFTYPNTSAEILKNLSFSLKEGQTLGIVGKTGSGKTTFIELLMRLYNPPKETIFIDGKDINTISPVALHNKIGYVPQESFLFAMSIAENIAFGNNNIELPDIIQLAKKAHIHNDIITFPDGYQTQVGERGVTLSGGQKQRIAIARALAGNHPLLIFDDCLSAVDTETEAAILSEINHAIRGRTSILVSHRISTVRNADLIIVLDKGQITEMGTHEDLLLKDGYYTHLYHLQKSENQTGGTNQ